MAEERQETAREARLSEMVDKALVVGTRLKRRLAIDKKMIEREIRYYNFIERELYKKEGSQTNSTVVEGEM